MEILIVLIIAGIIAPIAVSDTKKNLTEENKVAIISWIPMQMILLFASLVIMTYLGRILEISGELYGWSLRSGLIYSYGGLTTLLLAMLGVTIVGFFVLYRYEYGSRKFLVHCVVWYAVYWVLTVVVFLYETARWNVEWIAPVTSCFITVCIYPVMAFFGLKLVMTITRCIKKTKNK
jgi:hypothetical protein